MYAFLGVHIAGTITGGVGAALIIVPFILFRYGERLRSKSPFASEQLEAEE